MKRFLFWMPLASLVIFLTFLAAGISQSATIEGKVAWVDADTLWVKPQQEGRVKVRLSCIDAPN